MLNYTYVGPTLLVVPLFLISLVNLFIAGPPLKTVVLNSNGPTYGARLPFMQLHVQGGTARFSLSPKDEMTHFFVITCYAQSVDGALSYDAQARHCTSLRARRSRPRSDAPRRRTRSEAGGPTAVPRCFRWWARDLGLRPRRSSTSPPRVVGPPMGASREG